MKTKQMTLKKEFSVVSLPEKPESLLSLFTPYTVINPELCDVYFDFEVRITPAELPSSLKEIANKIVFPIHNDDGNIVGYISNQQKNNQNIPEYACLALEDDLQVSNILYGLHKAKASILAKGYVFIVEGCEDVLAMHAAGYNNTVGICGTIISQPQIELIKQYATRVFTVFNSGREGKMAALKTQEELKDNGIECYRILLPEVSTPDSFFRTVDKIAFCQKIRKGLQIATMRENLFIAACLYYGNLAIDIKGQSHPYHSLLFNYFQVSCLLPELPIHKEILWYLSENTPVEQYSQAAYSIAESLYKGYKWVFTELENHAKAEGKNVNSDFNFKMMEFFAAFYKEERVIRMIKKLTFRFNNEEDPQKQISLLGEIKDYKNKLLIVTNNLQHVESINTSRVLEDILKELE